MFASFDFCKCLDQVSICSRGTQTVGIHVHVVQGLLLLLTKGWALLLKRDLVLVLLELLAVAVVVVVVAVRVMGRARSKRNGDSKTRSTAVAPMTMVLSSTTLMVMPNGRDRRQAQINS